ncbi:MAG: hypothetical protein D6B25_02220 [Desulfobulbaceae bacterium]|nr:MAG: hypothetical protein D6B25_02220 [Desulfobulbaceae bacterium]
MYKWYIIGLLTLIVIVCTLPLVDSAHSAQARLTQQQLNSDHHYRKFRQQLHIHPGATNRFAGNTCEELASSLQAFNKSLPTIHEKIAFYQAEVKRLSMSRPGSTITDRTALEIAKDWLKGWNDMLRWTKEAINEIYDAAAAKGCSQRILQRR